MSTPATTFAATAAPAPDHLELPVPVVHVVQSLQVQFFDTVVETPVSLTVQGNPDLHEFGTCSRSAIEACGDNERG